jgi:hypothetical protein
MNDETKTEVPAVTSSAHTAGPWKMSGSTTAVYRAVQNGNWAGHSDLNEPIAWLTDTGRNAKETEANARLIAAAPELLAALRELVEVGRTVLSPVHDSGAVKGRTDHEILVAAVAALAKAEGGPA